MSSDGYSSSDLEKPPGKRELAREMRDLDIMATYARSGCSIQAVRSKFNLPTIQAAQIAINRAHETWREVSAREVEWDRDKAQILLREMLDTLAPAFFAGDFDRVGDLLKVMERQSKLDAHDAQREQTGNVFNINLALPPEAGEIVDTLDGSWEPAGELPEGATGTDGGAP